LSVDEYLARPYQYVLTPQSVHGQEVWGGVVKELPGVVGQGQTAAEAIEQTKHSMRAWIASALEDGEFVPMPEAEQQYSGRFLTRVSPGLHARLAQRAAAEGMSLNQLVARALAQSLASVTSERHIGYAASSPWANPAVGSGRFRPSRLDEAPARVSEAADSGPRVTEQWIDLEPEERLELLAGHVVEEAESLKDVPEEQADFEVQS
jgi:predicted RNase H-like HicB family nuclease